MFKALKDHLPEVTPLEKIKVNTRKGTPNPSTHAVHSREARRRRGLRVRQLKTLGEKYIIKYSIPELLEWGEYAISLGCHCAGNLIASSSPQGLEQLIRLEAEGCKFST